MIVRLVSVALDARASTATEDPLARARAARWIAGNVLAARGDGRSRPPEPHGADTHAPTSAPTIVEWRVTSLGGLLAEIAARPALVDGGTLPLAWRTALYVIGIPLLDRAPEAALAAGASIARVVTPSRMLAA